MAITGVGQYHDFEYTGGIQTFTTPIKGLYRVSTWGAQGGSTNIAGAYGGSASVYKILEKNQVLYITVGGKGGSGIPCTGKDSYGGGSPGFNGGGSGGNSSGCKGQPSSYRYSGGGGGGCTIIASINHSLSSLNDSQIYIIAGGGGGSIHEKAGQIGGQSSGTTNMRNGSNGENGYYEGWSECGGGGGGAGYRGGIGGGISSNNRGGYGGTSWTGNVPAIEFGGVTYNSEMSAGVKADNGMARIMLIKLPSTMYYNNTLIEKVFFNSVNVDKITFNGESIFEM